MKLNNIVKNLVIGIKLMVVSLIGAVIMFPLRLLPMLGVGTDRPVLMALAGAVGLVLIPVGLVVAGWVAHKIWKWN